ncbi:MAG: DUF1194 domain-containing protein [Pseudomonadota bacterium]|nr:DUF1194 domain-containing protein [Pseudomonadota bacterium]
MNLCLLAAVALLGVAEVCVARAAEPVDVALVVLDDVSGSINEDEYKLEKEGYFDAFTSAAVVNAIKAGPLGAIAVSFVEFAGAGQVANVLDWAVIRDEASARAFAQRMREAPRSAWGRTAIGDGITLALQDLAQSGYQPTRRVIDLAGDGTNNAGRPVQEARDEAIRKGIIINGLAIANESNVPWLQAHTHPPGGLDGYYRQNVTTGEGSFVLVVHDYRSFGQAVTRKLFNEIAEATPEPMVGVRQVADSRPK